MGKERRQIPHQLEVVGKCRKYFMNIQEAKEEIRRAVLAYTRKNADGSYRIPTVKQRPLLLIGPPGIGKTAIMEQVAEECGVGLVAYTITHHTRQSAIGLPVIREACYGGIPCSVTEYTMSEIIASVYDSMEKTGKKEGILFIDEINCVSETLAPAMLQFLQCKTFGSHQVPPGWIIAAAGNPPGYNKSVRAFDVVTLDRIRLLQVEADLSVWKTFARQEGIQESILSFLEIRPQDFYRMENFEENCCFVTARGWEDLSRMLDVYEELELPVTRSFVQEFLQYPMVAGDFSKYYTFYQRYRRQMPVSQILSGNWSEALLKEAAAAPYEDRITGIHLLLEALLSNGEQEEAGVDGWQAAFGFLETCYGDGPELAVFLEEILTIPKALEELKSRKQPDFFRLLERQKKKEQEKKRQESDQKILQQIQNFH